MNYRPYHIVRNFDNLRSSKATYLGSFLALSLACSGRDTILLSPGIQYILFDNALLETSFQYPVLERVNGKQFHQDYTVLFGFRVLF